MNEPINQIRTIKFLAKCQENLYILIYVKNHDFFRKNILLKTYVFKDNFLKKIFKVCDSEKTNWTDLILYFPVRITWMGQMGESGCQTLHVKNLHLKLQNHIIQIFERLC